MKWLVLITGHLGALGRAGLFLLVSVLMWRALDGTETPNPDEKEKNTIGRAFTQLQASRCLTHEACSRCAQCARRLHSQQVERLAGHQQADSAAASRSCGPGLPHSLLLLLLLLLDLSSGNRPPRGHQHAIAFCVARYNLQHHAH